MCSIFSTLWQMGISLPKKRRRWLTSINETSSTSPTWIGKQHKLVIDLMRSWWTSEGILPRVGAQKARKTRKILQLIKIMIREPMKMANCLRPNLSFCLHGRQTFPWVACRDSAMFCTVCEENPNLSDSLKVLASRKLVLASEIKVVTSHWASLQKS